MFDLAHTAAKLGDELLKRARDGRDDLIERVQDYRRPPSHLDEARSFLGGTGGQVAGAAAIGVLAGMALGAARKLAVQGAEATAGDWFEVLKLEHRKVEVLFEALLDTSDKQTLKRTFLLGKIAKALSKHAMQEEMVVYPAIKEATGGEQAMALYADHAEVKIYLHDLQEIAKGDPLWIERAREFHEHLTEHMRLEEDEVFPAYHGRMSPQQNRRLTLALHREGVRLA